MEMIPGTITKTLLAAALLLHGAAKAQYNNSGDSIFNLPVIHRIDINSTDPNFWDSLVANKPLDRKILCSLVLDGVQQMDSVGIQLKGNSSYNSMPTNKKPFKLQFDYVKDGQDWDGIKEIVLNNGFKDPTMVREKIFLDFCNRNYVYSPRCTYANVYINNTLWGFYTLVESVSSKKFLDKCFDDKKGNLFKGDPNGTLQWFGSSPSNYYTRYELKTNETENNWSDLVELIDKINNTPAANYYDSLETILDTYSFINGWAANIIFANLDSYQGSGHNYYLYHDSIINKFRFITWDVNEAFGNFQMQMSVSQIENMSAFYISNPPQNRPIEQKMLADATYRANYIWTLCAMVQNNFTVAKLNASIDSLTNAIRTYVYADPQKQYSNQDFETNITNDVNNIPGLKTFVSVRRNALMNEMANYGCYLNTDEVQSGYELKVYPVPAIGLTTIELPEIMENISLALTNVLGQTVLVEKKANTRFIEVDVSGLAEGIYTVNVNNTLFRTIQVSR